jgi:hypothetical protein
MNVKSYLIDPESEGLLINSLPQKNGVNRYYDTDSPISSWFNSIIPALRKLCLSYGKSEKFTLDCFQGFFHHEISKEDKEQISAMVLKIGFENTRDSFETINRECENITCESEDLFGIFKRHQFKMKTPLNKSKMYEKTIHYIHLTLIHLNIIFNQKNEGRVTEMFVRNKEDFDVLRPLFSLLEKIMLESIRKRLS